jgi:hypothetical protein
MFFILASPHHHFGPEIRDGVRDGLVVDGRRRRPDRLVAPDGKVLAHRDERLVEQDPQEDQVKKL